MENQLKIGLAQINTNVGDFESNYELIVSNIEKAERKGCDILAFPELSISGYPPEDLLLNKTFLKTNTVYLNKIISHTKKLKSTIIIGSALIDDHSDVLRNSLLVIKNGKVKKTYHKIFLPNYGVFDEKRYFEPGNKTISFKVSNNIVGVSICEDIWEQKEPLLSLLKRVDLLVNINASPFEIEKQKTRIELLRELSSKNSCCIAYVNQVGGQDELVFDGNSMIFNETGNLVSKSPSFKEDLLITDLYGNKSTDDQETSLIRNPSSVSEIYKALCLSVRDYARKNKFKKCVIGISGGIDSALTATIANDAIGNKNIIGISMPSKFSSKGSMSDAEKLCSNLNMELLTIPIKETHKAFENSLSNVFVKHQPDVTDENIQSRIRGSILMALSNKFNWLVLTTGNKSEISMGYSTLYGDTAGGFSVLKDIPKTLVYKIAKYRNTLNNSNFIPETILKKAPSAELRPNQLDTDSLPNYELLDPIIDDFVVKGLSSSEIIRRNARKDLNKNAIKDLLHKINTNEYKRRQSPIGVKISQLSFGKERRMPISNSFKELKGN